MNPLFGKKKREIGEGKNAKHRIKEILSKEKILKEGEYKHGKIYLTENHLLWEKKEKIGSAIIPLNSIRKSELATKLRLGSCLKVVYGEDEKEKFFPFISDGRISTGQLDDIQDWIVTLETGFPSKVFTNIVYAGGYSAYPEKHNGQLVINPTTLTFQERKGDFRLEIPLTKIENVSVKTTSEISRLSTVLVGPLWSMGFPAKSKLVAVEYEDEMGVKQIPLFDFPLDGGDKKKGKVMRAVHEQLKEIKVKPKEKKISVAEDPLKILKIRYAKGEISREEYKEMKKIIEGS
mgnify:CR=1 FL=1